MFRQVFSPVFPFCGQFGLPNVCCQDKNLFVKKNLVPFTSYISHVALVVIDKILSLKVTRRKKNRKDILQFTWEHTILNDVWDVHSGRIRG